MKEFSAEPVLKNAQRVAAILDRRFEHWDLSIGFTGELLTVHGSGA